MFNFWKSRRGDGKNALTTAFTLKNPLKNNLFTGFVLKKLVAWQDMTFEPAFQSEKQDEARSHGRYGDLYECGAIRNGNNERHNAAFYKKKTYSRKDGIGFIGTNQITHFLFHLRKKKRASKGSEMTLEIIKTISK